MNNTKSWELNVVVGFDIPTFAQREEVGGCRSDACNDGTRYLTPAGGQRVVLLRSWKYYCRRCIDKEGAFWSVCFLISLRRAVDNG